MDDNLQDFKESMNAWGWSVNARNNFNKFMDAIETEQGLIEQIQRIQSIIDDIVLNKEISQFKKCLEVGTEYYRARIINPEDDDDLKKGIGKTQDNKFMGYDDINSKYYEYDSWELWWVFDWETYNDGSVDTEVLWETVEFLNTNFR